MAVMALINEYLSLNAVAMSDHVRQATLAMEATALDSTAMGDGWTKNVYGLKSGSLQVEFNDDTAVSQVDALLWPLFGTNVAFEVRLDAGVVSASNPKYTGLVGIAQHNVGGSLNEVARKSLTFPTSGAVTRATA
jgi:hypothetical protein